MNQEDKLVIPRNRINIYECLFDRYLMKIHPLIRDILDKARKPFVYEPTIFGDNSEENVRSLEVAFKQRQIQMKEGMIAQIIIGNFIGWEDLGIKHSTRLDCRKKDNSIIIEVKNKYNTCNSRDSEKVKEDLAKYKKENPKTRCVWGIVNPKPGSHKLSEKIICQGLEIEKIQGEDLFKLVSTLGGIDYSQRVIKFVRKIMEI